MKTKTDIGLQNFRSALDKLEEFLALPIENDRDKAGIIQAFEFSYEQCWKIIQKHVESHQLTVGSPKQAFQAAFKLGWMAEEQQGEWTQMMLDRNLTSHTYKGEIADEVLSRINTHKKNMIEMYELLRVVSKSD